MKLTLDIKDDKVPFFLELLNNFQDFVSIENKDKIVGYTTAGKPLTVSSYTQEVMRGYADIKEGRTVSSKELIEKAKSW